MRRRNRPRPMAEQLELAFYHSFLRLSEQDRRRVMEELTLPFQRLWLIVDAHGVRRLEE